MTNLTTNWNKIPEPVIEGVKELGRVALIAVIPIIIAGLETNTFSWKLILVVAAIAILKGLDKFVHKTGVEQDNDSLSKGLTRF